MKKSKYFIGGTIVVLLIVIGYMFGQKDSQNAQAQGKLEIVQQHYDFGTIGLDDVSHVFLVKNIGIGPLKIEKVSTSCGCTTAQLKQGDKKSVKFGMDHGNLPPANMILEPEEEAEVVVTYNPLAHGLNKAAGTFRRIVYLQTSNPKKEYELTIAVTVDPDKKIINDARIEFDQESYDFGKILKKDGIVEKTFKVKNSGSKELVVENITTSCACTSAEISDNSISPGAQTDLIVRFDPNFHKEPQGKLDRVVTLFTNDPERPEINIKIYAEIIE